MRNDTDIQTLARNLRASGYKVACFETAASAAEYLDAQIDGRSVGFGGSVTLEQMGLYDRLRTHNEVFWHHRTPAGKTSVEVRALAGAAEVYVSSVNAVAESGEIVNIDGTGNRVASIFYGHKKVFLVIGRNKIEKDCGRAVHRARNVAAPLNAARLGVATPCAAQADRCYDCDSPERICRGLCVLWGRPMAGEYEVVLVMEDLGF